MLQGPVFRMRENPNVEEGLYEAMQAWPVQYLLGHQTQEEGRCPKPKLQKLPYLRLAYHQRAMRQRYLEEAAVAAQDFETAILRHL